MTKLQKLFLLLTCYLGLVASGFAQEEKFEKASVKNSIEFSGNVNKTWSYLSDLGNLQNLVPSTIAKSVLTGQGVGSTVKLTLTNGGTIVEKIVQLDNTKKIICYTMIETPLPIRNYLACFEVKPLDNKRMKVEFTAEFEVQPFNRQQRIDAFNKLQVELLENLKKITYPE